MRIVEAETGREQAEAEAAERFSLLLSGKASDAERAEIETWRAAGEANAAAWNRMSAIWTGSVAPATHPAILAMRAAALSRNARPPARQWLDWRSLALAASLVAVIGTSVWVGVPHMPWTRSEKGVAVADSVPWSDEVRTQIGQIRSLRLEDGSVVTINTDSALRTALSAADRRVQLSRGEAYFKVASDRSRPFSVGTGDIVVTALGTAFSVRNMGDAVVVTLIEGRISVEAAGRREKIALTPGSQLRMDADGFHRSLVDTARATSWTTGTLSFHQTQLGAAIDEMNRYSARRIVLADGGLGRLPVSGLFPTGEQDRFVDMLVATGKIRVSRRTASQVDLAAP